MTIEKDLQGVSSTFLFTKIFRTFRIAIQPSKLFLAFLAIAFVCVAGWLMDFTNTVVTSPGLQGPTSELQVYIQNEPQTPTFIEQNQAGQRQGVFTTLWHFSVQRFHMILASLLALSLPGIAAAFAELFKAIAWAARYHTIYFIIFGLVKLTAVSIAGGAICRIAALQFALAEKPGIFEALRYSIKRFFSFFCTPLAPLGIIIVLGIPIIILGLITNIPRLGELFAAFSMPVTLLLGSLIAVILIGTGAGFGLMFPAIAYDGSDCFDAISRAFNYVYTRPWRFIFYSVIAAIYGAACYLFVRFFAFMLILGARFFLQLPVFTSNSDGRFNKIDVLWPQPQFDNLLGTATGATLNWSESIAVYIIFVFILAVVGLIVAFIFSFFFSGNTIIYALLRSHVDNTPIEEIYNPVPAMAGQPAPEPPPQDTETAPDKPTENQ